MSLYILCIYFEKLLLTVKPVLSGHSKIDKTKMIMTNGGLMKVQSICNTFDLHKAIIGLEKTIFGLLFEWLLKTGFTVCIDNQGWLR